MDPASLVPVLVRLDGAVPGPVADAFVAALADAVPEARVTHRLQAYGGVSVVVPAAAVPVLRGLPHVRAVEVDERRRRPPGT